MTGSVSKTRVKQFTTINGKTVKEIGSMYELTFYRTTPYEDDYVYVARRGFVIGTMECGVSQGGWFIESIKEVL
jgi:hypothetical protein